MLFTSAPQSQRAAETYGTRPVRTPARIRKLIGQRTQEHNEKEPRKDLAGDRVTGQGARQEPAAVMNRQQTGQHEQGGKNIGCPLPEGLAPNTRGQAGEHDGEHRCRSAGLGLFGWAEKSERRL